MRGPNLAILYIYKEGQKNGSQFPNEWAHNCMID